MIKKLAIGFISWIAIFSISCKSNPIEQNLSQTIQEVSDSSVTLNPIKKIWENDPFLMALIDTVLNQNTSYLIEYQQIQIAKQQFGMSASFLKPFTSVQVNPSQRKFGKYSMDGVGNYDTQFSPNLAPDMRIPEHLPDLQIGLQTSWELDIWGKLKDRKKAQALRYLSTNEGYKWLKTQLITQTAILYGELVALDRELEILNSNIDIQNKAVELVKIQKEAGVVNEMAVLQLEAQLENSKAQVSALKNEIILKENEIRQLVNNKSFKINRNLIPIETDFSSSYREIPLDYLTQRPDVRQSQLELEAQLFDTKAAKLALKPSFVLSNFIGVQGFRPEYLFQLPASLSYSILANLSKPLFNKTLIKSDISISESRLKNLQLTYLQTLNNAIIEWDSNLKGLDYMNTQIKHKAREVNLNIRSIQTVGELFQTNKANYLEILTAQQNALKSELDLLEIYKKRWIYSIQLYKILGGN